MKKVLEIILAIAMIASFASLAACSSTAKETEETTATETTETTETTESTESTAAADGEVDEATLEASKNNEYVRQKLAAGWDMQIACSAQTDIYFVATQLMGAACDIYESYGFTTQYLAAADNTVSTQLNQLETLVTANEVCGICIQTGDPASLQPAVEAAQDAGITVVIYGITADYDTIVAMTDTYSSGWGAGEMAKAWCSVRYPDAGDGEIHAAVFGASGLAPVEQLTQAMKESLEDDPRFTVPVFYNNEEGSDTDDGFDAAQSALLIDPDIRVFLCYQMAAGLGVNNYLESQGYDFADFGIFATSTDDTTDEMLALASNNESAFRGTMAAGGGTADTMAYTMVEALLDGTVPLGTVRIDPLTAQTSSDYECDYSIGDPINFDITL